jgi:hypothetical protein
VGDVRAEQTAGDWNELDLRRTEVVDAPSTQVEHCHALERLREGLKFGSRKNARLECREVRAVLAGDEHRVVVDCDEFDELEELLLDVGVGGEDDGRLAAPQGVAVNLSLPPSGSGCSTTAGFFAASAFKSG